MKSTDLTIVQCQEIHDRLAPTLGYLSRLCERLDKRRFEPDDKLYRDAQRAQAAMQALAMTLHYLTCKDGVGYGKRE